MDLEWKTWRGDVPSRRQHVHIQASVGEMSGEMKRLIGLARPHWRKGRSNNKNFHSSVVLAIGPINCLCNYSIRQ